MVDDAETRASDDRRIGHVISQPFDELLALPQPVQPVRVTTVTTTDVNGHREFGLDVEVNRCAVGSGRVDRGAGGDAGAGSVVDLDPRPAQLFHAAVAPDPGAVVE